LVRVPNSAEYSFTHTHFPSDASSDDRQEEIDIEANMHDDDGIE
jgi:hypothetical protein